MFWSLRVGRRPNCPMRSSSREWGTAIDHDCVRCRLDRVTRNQAFAELSSAGQRNKLNQAYRWRIKGVISYLAEEVRITYKTTSHDGLFTPVAFMAHGRPFELGHPKCQEMWVNINHTLTMLWWAILTGRDVWKDKHAFRKWRSNRRGKSEISEIFLHLATEATEFRPSTNLQRIHSLKQDIQCIRCEVMANNNVWIKLGQFC